MGESREQLVSHFAAPYISPGIRGPTSSEPKLRLGQYAHGEANREPGILLDQGFGPKAGCDRPAVEVLTICDCSKMAQRIAETHQPFEVAGVPGRRSDCDPGISDLDAVSHLLADLHDELPGKVTRFRHLADLGGALGSQGTMLFGGTAAFNAWMEARSSFVHGNFAARTR